MLLSKQLFVLAYNLKLTAVGENCQYIIDLRPCDSLAHQGNWDVY